MKEKSTATLFAIFLGTLGVHRFYLNDIGMGVLYILTGGLCGIGAVVDIVRLVLMTEEEFNRRYNRPPQF